jgi:hypothetical protein
MYAKYAYTASATPAQIVSDLVALLTGTTNKATLGAGCDQANTEIISTIPAGWTIHDASAGTNKQVIKAPFSYNGALFKYLMLDHSISTTRITFYGYETWDAIAHTGTNQTQNGANYLLPKGSGVGGFFYVFASAKFAAITATTGSSWGDESYGGITIFSEYSRAAPWSSTSMPHAALIQTGACIGASPYEHVFPLKAVDKVDAVLTGTNARAQLGTIGVILGTNGYSQPSYFPNGSDFNIGNGLGAEFTPLFPLYVMKAPVYGIPIGDLSASADFWLLPNNLVGNLTTFQYGGNDYISVKIGGGSTTTNDSGFRIAFRKG